MKIRYFRYSMQTRLKHYILIIGLIIISLVGVKGLFHSGFYTSHDGWHMVARLYYFYQSLQDGQFPPRWGGLLLNKFGYPLFIYSYHLPWWIGSVFMYLGFNIFDAIKGTFILTYVLSGITMYLEPSR